ncbi:hypothetical protein HOK00_11325 [bacterium]|jgi:hypothetical protein|nr:hypothetical protein [bacterium]
MKENQIEKNPSGISDEEIKNPSGISDEEILNALMTIVFAFSVILGMQKYFLGAL